MLSIYLKSIELNTSSKNYTPDCDEIISCFHTYLCTYFIEVCYLKWVLVSRYSHTFSQHERIRDMKVDVEQMYT